MANSYRVKIHELYNAMLEKDTSAKNLSLALGKSKRYIKSLTWAGNHNCPEQTAKDICILLDKEIEDLFYVEATEEKVFDQQWKIMTSTGKILDKPDVEVKKDDRGSTFMERKRFYEEVQDQVTRLSEYKNNWLLLKNWISDRMWNGDDYVAIKDLVNEIRSLEG